MPVCGSVVGGGEPLCEWNGLPWKILLKTNAGSGETDIEGII